MDEATQEILNTIRDEYTIEQMMVEEDKLRRASEHLLAALGPLRTLQNQPDLTDLTDFIEEVEAAIGFLREARRG